MLRFLSDSVCYVGNGEGYVGPVSKGRYGRDCQAWDSQTPHNHPFGDPNKWTVYADSDITKAGNFCRNPDGQQSWPYCYTVDGNVTKESCQVPKCVCK